ncbi:hypothetical protein ACQPYK_02425 [Streptosporangium sp. CA-135522]
MTVTHTLGVQVALLERARSERSEGAVRSRRGLVGLGLALRGLTGAA